MSYPLYAYCATTVLKMDKNAQKCLEMIINGTQGGNGERAIAEILRDVVGRVNGRACEFR